MLLSVLSWIVFGALVGWITIMIIGDLEINESQTYTGVLIGVIGAVLAGSIMYLAGGVSVIGQDFSSLFIAVIGAILLLALVSVIKKQE